MLDQWDEEVAENINCPICAEVPENEVFQCVNGHTICSKCINSLQNCPQCSVSYNKGRIRNRTLESLVASLKLECPHKQKGCKEVVRRRNMPAHQQKCIYSGQSIQLCQYLGYKCEFWCRVSDPSSALDHLSRTHNYQRVNGSSVNIRLENVTEDETIYEDCMWTPVLLNLQCQKQGGGTRHSLNFAFLNTYYANDDAISCTCILLGTSPVDLKECEVSIKVESRSEKVSSLCWKVRPISVLEVSEILPWTPFRVPVPLLRKHFLNPLDNSLVFTIKVEKMCDGTKISEVIMTPSPSKQTINVARLYNSDKLCNATNPEPLYNSAISTSNREGMCRLSLFDGGHNPGVNQSRSQGVSTRGSRYRGAGQSTVGPSNPIVPPTPRPVFVSRYAMVSPGQGLGRSQNNSNYNDQYYQAPGSYFRGGRNRRR